MEQLKCDKFTAPAFLMVPFCESQPPERWLYNDIIDHLFNRNVQSSDELRQVEEYFEEVIDTIVTHPQVNDITLPRPEESAREVYRNFHKKVFKLVDKEVQ